METTARTKLSELPISWHERYTEKTEYLQKMYRDIVGPGSYFRFEGTNSENNDEYFVVVGPAKVHSPKAEFFCGVRKLPSDYAASGEYFDEMEECMDYAVATWGVKQPSSMSKYTSSDLSGMSQKVKKWREEHKEGSEEYEPSDDKDKAPSYESVIHKMEKQDSMNNNKYMYVRTNEFPFYRKVSAVITPDTPVSELQTVLAMGAPARFGRQGYKWYDLDHAALGMDEEYAKDKSQWPQIENAFNIAWKQRDKFRNTIADFYGPEYVNAEFYHVWLCFQEDFGAYVVSIGPSFETEVGGDKQLIEKPYVRADGSVDPNRKTRYQPLDRFDVFWKRLNIFSEDFISKKISQRIGEYSEKYGVDLVEGDFIPPEAGAFGPEFKLTAQGRGKVYESVKDYYEKIGYQFKTKGLSRQLAEAYKKEHMKWQAQLDSAYQKSQESGDAFIKQQPPPPNIKWMKPRPIGQQKSTQRNVSTGEDGGDQSGFGSLSEAIDFIQARNWGGCPMLEDYDDVTGEELAQARESNDSKVIADPSPVPEPKKVPVNQPEEFANQTSRPEEVEVSESLLDALMGEDDDIYSDTIIKLVKMASDMDHKGQGQKSEEIHKILRKHASLRKAK